MLASNENIEVDNMSTHTHDMDIRLDSRLVEREASGG